MSFFDDYHRAGQRAGDSVGAFMRLLISLSHLFALARRYPGRAAVVTVVVLGFLAGEGLPNVRLLVFALLLFAWAGWLAKRGQ